MGRPLAQYFVTDKLQLQIARRKAWKESDGKRQNDGPPSSCRSSVAIQRSSSPMNNEPIQDKPSALIRFWNVICVWIGGPISPKRRAAIAREEEKQKKGKRRAQVKYEE